MTIANNLVNQGYSRTAAMVKAWILVKLPKVETKVNGVTFSNRQKALEHLKRYCPQDITISLQRQPQNDYGGSAVAVIATVKNKGSYCMGYLPKALAALIAPLLDKGKAVQSYFNKVKVCQEFLPYGLSIIINV